MKRFDGFWHPMPPGSHKDLFWAAWVTAILIACLILLVAALDVVHATPLYHDTNA